MMEEPVEPSGAARKSHAEGPSTGAAVVTVLVIEAYAAALQALALVLEEAGHCVLTARDDHDALARYEPVAATIDVVVGASPATRTGLGALAQCLRRRSPRVRIVVLAGLGALGAEAAPDDVIELQMPIDVDALLACVAGARRAP